MTPSRPAQPWPELSFATLRPTIETLQLWTQVVGKVRLAQTPWLNHSWHVTLYVSARGLATGLIPHGPVSFQMEFDFVAGALVIRVSDGGERRIALSAGSVAAFYAEVLGALDALGAPVLIDPLPNEVADPVPFPEDHRPRPYDAAVARDYWRALVQVERVLSRFRTRFIGKCSPVHLFWGSFDIAVTRFSGRRAPLHPGGVPHLPDAVTREAYSHEVSSAGFWPGGGGVDEPCFYAYAYPTPAGFAEAAVSPPAARFDPALGEFLLPYAAVRAAPDPDAALLAFLQSTYAAAADLAHWDRVALECGEGRPRRPRPVG
ncbi:MAG: DUF5996 family protein [Caulobacteraceae bacterium]|nr:DUF5996 family protein [Caulobacteraceae bacterium]